MHRYTFMQAGHPVECELYRGDEKVDDARLEDLSEREIFLIKDWIAQCVQKTAKTHFSKNLSSVNLYAICEEATGVTLSHVQFKDAMYLAGFHVDDTHEYNWHFQIEDYLNPYHKLPNVPTQAN